METLVIGLDRDRTNILWAVEMAQQAKLLANNLNEPFTFYNSHNLEEENSFFCSSFDLYMCVWACLCICVHTLVICACMCEYTHTHKYKNT